MDYGTEYGAYRKGRGGNWARESGGGRSYLGGGHGRGRDYGAEYRGGMYGGEIGRGMRYWARAPEEERRGELRTSPPDFGGTSGERYDAGYQRPQNNPYNYPLRGVGQRWYDRGYGEDYYSPGPTYGLRDANYARGGYGG
jgi:hypothetical protein